MYNTDPLSLPTNPLLPYRLSLLTLQTPITHLAEFVTSYPTGPQLPTDLPSLTPHPILQTTYLSCIHRFSSFTPQIPLTL